MAKRIKTEAELMQRVIKMLPDGIGVEAIESVEVDNLGGVDGFNGYWVYLNDGYISPEMGCHTIHEDTLSELADVVGSIEVWADDPDLIEHKGYTTYPKAEAQEGEAMNETTNNTNNTEEEETMTTAQAIDAIISYFEENEDEFIEVIEELDSWCGYLGDDRYYDMYLLDEFYAECEPSELLARAYYGHDDDTWTTDEHGEKHYGEFCPNRDYFYYNGYGNLVSSDYKDYSAHLDKWFAEKLIDEAYNIDSIPDDVQSIIDSIED